MMYARRMVGGKGRGRGRSTATRCALRWQTRCDATARRARIEVTRSVAPNLAQALRFGSAQARDPKTTAWSVGKGQSGSERDGDMCVYVSVRGSERARVSALLLLGPVMPDLVDKITGRTLKARDLLVVVRVQV